MGYSYDFFVAEMLCPVCGNVSALDSGTNMQTYLNDLPSLSWLKVGDNLLLEPERINRNEYEGYYLVNRASENSPIVILQIWECPNCGVSDNWAAIEIEKGLITSIESVMLNAENIARCNLISVDVISVVQSLTDLSFHELVELDVIELLKQKLM